MALSISDFRRVAAAAQDVVAARGAAYYRWVNAPVADASGKITHPSGWGDSSVTREIGAVEALAIMTGKLNGAYGERFVTSLGLVAALIIHGYEVRFVQLRKEIGVQFNATGWTVIAVQGMPLFHISPEDLRLDDVSDFVEVLDDNEHSGVKWAGTNKVGEFAALLAGACEPGLDLVAIAQAASK